MKRSTAIEFVAEKLLQTTGVYGGSQDECEEVREQTKFVRLKMALVAIQACEELGMKPPVYKCPVLFRDEYGWERETFSYGNEVG
jgi:hypothetical protein